MNGLSGSERLKDLGLAAATIQRAQISNEQVTTLFWINTGVGAAVAALISAISVPIARFYGDDRSSRVCVLRDPFRLPKRTNPATLVQITG